MTQQEAKKQPDGRSQAPIGKETNLPETALAEVVLRELEAIKQRQSMAMLPAIPLEAFLYMLRVEFNFDLPVRTAQAMIADGRIPQMPKLSTKDKPWVNLVRWREMAKEPSNYLHMAHENSRHRIAKPATTKSKQRAAA